MLFRLAFRRAVRLAELRGEISEEDANVLHNAIRSPHRWNRAGKRIDLLDEIEDDAAIGYHAEQVMAGVSAPFDWGSLIDWIKSHLPEILQLIASLISIFILLSPPQEGSNES